MAWRCRFLTARRSQHGSVVTDSLVDFHAGYDAADADAGWTNARAAQAAQAAKEKSDAYLPLFECLRFSDCLLARAAQLPVRKLYEHCPLGPPRALVPPPREPRPAAAAASPKKSLLRSAVSVVKAAVQLSPRAARARPRRSTPAAAGLAAQPRAGPDHATRRPGSARHALRRRARRQRGSAAPEAAAAAALPRHRQDRRGDRLPPRQGRETGGADARGPVPHRRRERLVVF